MSDTPRTTCSELLKCPLCEGRGELAKQQLLDRLSEKDLGRKVENYMSTRRARRKGIPARTLRRSSTEERYRLELDPFPSGGEGRRNNRRTEKIVRQWEVRRA
jgi:hypothetical protein